MNMIYNKALYRMMDHVTNVPTATFKLIMFRETSTYVPSPADATVAAIISGGAIEVTVASYARQTLASQAVAEDDSGNRAWFDADNIACGNLETGQSVGSFLIYEHIGADSSNIPWLYWDGLTLVTVVAPVTHVSPRTGTISAVTQANPASVTVAGHGFTTGDHILIKNVVGMTQLNNLEYTITVVDVNTFTLGVDSTSFTTYSSAGNAHKAVTVYCKPLDFDLQQGSALTFNGAATGFISNAPVRNATSFRIADLNADVSALDFIAACQTTLVLPLGFGGGAFAVNFPVAGVFESVNRV